MRVILIVLDSVGIGALPDADKYGDEGSDTLGNIAREVGSSGFPIWPRSDWETLSGWLSPGLS